MVGWPLYLLTESKRPPEGVMPFHAPGTWSEMLIAALTAIESEFVFVTMDDYWPIKPPTDPETLLEIPKFMKRAGVDIFGIHEPSHYYIEHPANMMMAIRDGYTFGTGPYIFKHFMPESPYHLSLCSAFWKRERLLGLIKPDDDPWSFETDGDDGKTSPRAAAAIAAGMKPRYYLPSAWWLHGVKRDVVLKPARSYYAKYGNWSPP